jgi:hypothetical protein
MLKIYSGMAFANNDGKFLNIVNPPKPKIQKIKKPYATGTHKLGRI